MVPHSIASFIEDSPISSHLEEGKYCFQSDQPEKPTPSILHKMAAEILGTYILIFFGCGSLLVNQRSNIGLLGVGLVWGAVVAALFYTIGPISGAHLNPAVTLAFAAIGRFPFKKVPYYFVAQMVGSISASMTLILLFEGDQAEAMLTLPGSSTGDWTAVLMEIIVSFVLMSVKCLGTDDRAVKVLAGVASGATVFVNVVIAGDISGCSMNPARSLGPAIATRKFDKILIYIFSPVVGMVAGSTSYYLLWASVQPSPWRAQTETTVSKPPPIASPLTSTKCSELFEATTP